MEDAEVLKELYETIKQNSKADYAGIIEQRASYPYLYHLSQIRENLVETAAEYAAHYGLTCVLKDAATVVASREGGIYINTSGTSRDLAR